MEFSDGFFEFFYQKTGIVFTDNKRTACAKIAKFAADKGFGAAEEFEMSLRAKQSLLQELIERLSINKTYFFREMKGFDVFFELLDTGRKVDILTLPCSSGEEAYTINILLRKRGLQHFAITACDIDSNVVEKAKAGVFGEPSFEGCADAKDKYFTKESDGYHIHPIYKKNITFLQKNIFDPGISKLGSFDFVFCRNLFIYFDKESKLKAQSAIHSLLKDGGVLIMGHADYPENHDGFEKIYSKGMYYYKKR